MSQPRLQRLVPDTAEVPVRDISRQQVTAAVTAVAMACAHQVMPDMGSTAPAAAAATDIAIILQSGVRQFTEPVVIIRRSAAEIALPM